MPRVLVIDDDPRVRSVMRLMLEQGGFEVEEAENGLAGIRALRLRGADLQLGHAREGRHRHHPRAAP
jgi:CheY-like chemotaxis protein